MTFLTLRRTMNVVDAVLRQCAALINVTPCAVLALEALAANPFCTGSAAAAHARRARQHTERTLHQLEAAGLVMHVYAASPRRSRRWALTPKGEARWAAVTQRLAAWTEFAGRSLDLDVLEDSLDSLGQTCVPRPCSNGPTDALAPAPSSSELPDAALPLEQRLASPIVPALPPPPRAAAARPARSHRSSTLHATETAERRFLPRALAPLLTSPRRWDG